MARRQMSMVVRSGHKNSKNASHSLSPDRLINPLQAIFTALLHIYHIYTSSSPRQPRRRPTFPQPAMPLIEISTGRRRSTYLEEGYTYVTRRRSRCPLLQRRPRSPQIVVAELDEHYERRYRSPSPEPRPRQHYHSHDHYHHQAPWQTPAARAMPTPDPPRCRSAALEAEIRELRNSYLAAQSPQPSLPRRCDYCGCTPLGCQCETRPRTAMRPEYGTTRRYGTGNISFDAGRDVNIEMRSPRRVRFADDDD